MAPVLYGPSLPGCSNVGHDSLDFSDLFLKFAMDHSVGVESSAPLVNFKPNWTTTSKVSDFGHFICRVS